MKQITTAGFLHELILTNEPYCKMWPFYFYFK